MAFLQKNTAFSQNHGFTAFDENHGFRDFHDFLLSLQITNTQSVKLQMM